MKEIELRNVKGCVDYSPREQYIRNYISDTLKKVFEKYGFKPYKEIFKAIAQARFNEYKDDYATAKAIKGNEVEKEVTATDKKGKATTKKTGNPDFKFDLFQI